LTEKEKTGKIKKKERKRKMKDVVGYSGNNGKEKVVQARDVRYSSITLLY